MSEYRYLTTNLLTGAVLGDHLPVQPESFARAISSASPGNCSLNLIPGNRLENATNIAAVQPRKSVLWVLQDDTVVWNGCIWDWNHQSILDGLLPLSCSTLESVMAHRVLSQTFKFTSTDVFDMFRTLVQYAVGLTPNGQIAGLTYTQGESGIRDTLTFDGTQYQLVSDALDTLVQTYEIEYSFRPYQDANGNFKTNVDLAFPYLGDAFPASGLVYSFPGNLTDYAFQATGSTSANQVIATAQPDTDSSTTSTDTTTAATVYTGTATDAADLAAGYPLSQVAVSISGTLWSSNAQVLNYAQGYLPLVTDTQLTPELTLPGGLTPQLKDTTLGSFAQFLATSDLHPSPGSGPGFAGQGRVTGWTLTPTGGDTAESVKIQMGDMTLTGPAIPAPVPVTSPGFPGWFGRNYSGATPAQSD